MLKFNKPILHLRLLIYWIRYLCQEYKLKIQLPLVVITIYKMLILDRKIVAICLPLKQDEFMNNGEHIGSPLQNEHPFALGRHPSTRGEFCLPPFHLITYPLHLAKIPVITKSLHPYVDFLYYSYYILSSIWVVTS
jgi:hypothetical protein